MRRLALLVVLAAIAGCGGSDEAGERSERTVTVEKRTVEVLGPAAASDAAGFDPRAIYERDAPGVVTVLALFGDDESPLGRRGSEGSGFVLNDRGEIATNAHVVTRGRGEDIKPVSQVYVRFADRNQVSAKVVGFDPNEDVALLKVDPEGLNLRPLPLGTSDDLEVGAPVAAIGSPFGEEGSLTVGIVSAVDRTIESLTQFSISGAIQTDAAINSGNSGGPLVDAQGRVIGINSQINSTSGSNAGVGYAVPIEAVRRSLDALREDGEVDYAYLGVSSAPLYPQLAEELGLPVDEGAIVAEVVEGGPADEAGLRGSDEEIRFQGVEVPEGSDVIIGIDDQKVRGADDLGQILENYRPGEKIELRIIRDGDRKTLEVTLGERPAQAQP